MLQGGSVVRPLAGVQTCHEKITDSHGWQTDLQLLSLTGMFMHIHSASSFYLLSFLDTMRELYEWVHTRQLIVNMRVRGLLTPNCNGDGYSEVRPGLDGLRMT